MQCLDLFVLIVWHSGQRDEESNVSKSLKKSILSFFKYPGLKQASDTCRITVKMSTQTALYVC